MANLLPAPAAPPTDAADMPKLVYVKKSKRQHPVTEHEAMAMVQDELRAEGRRLGDFHLSVTRYDRGSLSAELTTWPEDAGWQVWVLHDWIVQGLMQAGGSAAFINE